MPTLLLSRIGLVGCSRQPVVEEDVDVVFGCQQRADAALQDEVGEAGALDGLGGLRVGGVDRWSTSRQMAW
jgi:hypothetical protein